MTHVPITFDKLLDAFELASFGHPGESEAYLCRATGATHWHVEYGDNEEPLPDDVEDADKYVALPHKNELGLGRPLVLDFAREMMPGAQDEIRDMFARRGAYARFRDFVDRAGKLEQWYDYEDQRTQQAVRAWCVDNDIEIDD